MFLKIFFFGEHLRLCPWSLALSILVLGLERVCLSSEELSLTLALDFFVSLASSLVFSTPLLIHSSAGDFSGLNRRCARFWVKKVEFLNFKIITLKLIIVIATLYKFVTLYKFQEYYSSMQICILWQNYDITQLLKLKFVLFVFYNKILLMMN